MANFRALTIQSGSTTQIQDANSLIVGAGVTTSAGNLTITSAGGTVTVTGALTQTTGALSLTGNAASSVTTSSGALTLTSAAAATWSTGAGALSVSGFTGVNLQVNGSDVLDLTAATATVQAGATLTTTSTGNINLPNNASARFKVEGASVGATVTAANLGTLTDGSNADALHTHSGTDAAELVAMSLTTTGLANGDFGYVSAANTLSKTDSTALSTSRCVGANEGTAGTMTTDGIIESAKFTTDGGSPSNGAAVYLAAAADDAATGSGKLTATAPSSGVVAEVGICFSNANYAGAKTAKVLLQVKVPVQL